MHNQKQSYKDNGAKVTPPLVTNSHFAERIHVFDGEENLKKKKKKKKQDIETGSN